MSGLPDDGLAPPDSWEVADLDESMKRLMLSAKKQDRGVDEEEEEGIASAAAGAAPPPTDAVGDAPGVEKVEEDALAQIDQFLREALQNPRERLSVLRMEQDVLNFICDPTQQQMEFQQLPTSYLRLAAHRVAQHYCLQSMVLLDSNFPDGSNSRIIVRKTAECRMPSIRLADIPISLPSPDQSVVKVAIKQRPQKRSQNSSALNSGSFNSNSSKSMEERKEDYIRARARIFNSSSSNAEVSRMPETVTRYQESSSTQQGSIGLSRTEEKAKGSPLVNENLGRGLSDSSASSSGLSRSRSDKDPIGRYRPNNRVAIFRDREVDRKDPDYDRSYDRYMQRFDPGFGFSGGPFTVQPLYAPALNYNTEFPQLGSAARPQASPDHQTRPLPQHLPGSWTAPSSPAGIAYGHPDMIAQYSPNPVGARSSSAYLPSSQYACQQPGLPFVNPHEHVQQFTQFHHQQQNDANFGLARPR
ncbi:hypothetical protein MLD38_008595 [Melastoma candidum]|uniref:Uncharacterized protein n=1 Tax=Melastoma candidum TaxID=119954 RepID=A0ACB9RV15_9MYRT|nr:hypothetical protein MLD38_008595 [Melastoma candidum]